MGDSDTIFFSVLATNLRLTDPRLLYLRVSSSLWDASSDSFSRRYVSTRKFKKVKKAKNMAFAFDIDGVLVHGDRLIPEGKRALEVLNGDNELGIKIPHIFLTNGSGKPEQARCEQLSKILKNPVSTEQFIQSHTPMSALDETIAHFRPMRGISMRAVPSRTPGTPTTAMMILRGKEYKYDAMVMYDGQNVGK